MNPPDQPADTPRTDAECIQIYQEDVTGCYGAIDYVPASVTRALERELSDAKAEASHYMAVAQKATDEVIFFRADSLKAHQMTCAAALERDAEREKVRVLREALDEAQSCGGLTGSIFMQARAALASTEEIK
jgi:hypothetical protein